ncbi:MAG: winged helix-turn-helix transcriptional regulator [Theionarchaea archaeon]|nr:winged helix-turn-helix transcriptional regulator [Theionarchaea archaeon]
MSMRLTVEQKRKQYRTIYEAIWEDPRIFVKDLALLLDCTPTAASNRLKEAYDLGFIVGPDVRKKSYNNLREYMYFVNSENPESSYLKYREDPNITYVSKTSGFCNIWIVAKERIDIEEDVTLKGYRSDYSVSYAPNHSWKNAIEMMRKEIKSFNPKTFNPQHILETHFDETISWRVEDEILYSHFRCNLRNNIEPLMKEYKISGEKVYNFLNRLNETCTISTHYYPESLPLYDTYLFMFETDFEDFIIDLFSELPSSVSFFKVDDRLLTNVYVPWQVVRKSDLQVAPGNYYIPLLLMDLLKKGIIKKKEYAILEYFWRKSR